MGRRKKQRGFEALATLPWPVGVVGGIVAYLGMHYGIGWWFPHHGGMLSQGIAQQSTAMFGPLAWMLLGICWLAALFSYLGARSRRRFLETRTSLDSLAAGGWRQFELLVGEAFRRQGYSVEETGLGGADGGIDLILRKDGRRTLVQCKQWKRQQVGVSIVREMFGLLAHHHAHAVKIACIGTYTKDAERFAEGKPIELIGGEQLLDMIRAVQQQATAQSTSAPVRIDPVFASTESTASATIATPSCPRCGSKLVQRRNRRTRENFLGCSQFPKCRGTA
ncbi:restriction endonuclease [Xanthomonas campestris pv. campestris]|uniref:restriction endonuclease n=1 Tax=Xanthomonas campestris TaxID=339 RepID=UPI0023686EC6|nr:restriction endonuclease [Xanthomonas campestris]MDO0847350.1 restriction endonuclease [Xanthomonas campestris pv. campestris]MEB1415307.1 restriction endonuclease [Xanthomonas campestris pv. campestris]MEB1461241.1 restriction endonuclease [Xanthomonas campestris pv. campestris]MEB1502093.1 restriction endonuclease [Xanthomonas campestris pv. campestris]MEB1526635.1 restriction endonuclease [Xanthomonas campestris pv. campestris]